MMRTDDAPLDELNEHRREVPESSLQLVEAGQVTISPFSPEQTYRAFMLPSCLIGQDRTSRSIVCHAARELCHRRKSKACSPPHPTPLRIFVAGFARIRAYWARSLKSCDFSYNRMPLFFRIEILNGVAPHPALSHAGERGVRELFLPRSSMAS
jgi:hypothetical protein